MVHNEYGGFSGEEAVFHSVVALLRERGHEVRTFVRRSADLGEGLAGKVRGFVSGIWSSTARREFADELDAFRPEVVQVQNLFPLISASVLPEIRRRGVPLVMTCHNYRLFCPTGLMLRHGRPCTKCSGGAERWCVLHDCEQSLPKSFGYAWRNHVARAHLMAGVDVFQVLSTFQRDRFVEWGVDPGRIAVVPNFIAFAPATDAGGRDPGRHVGYVGRVSPEKGVDVLVEAARSLSSIPFVVVGSADRMPRLSKTAPANVSFVGELPRDRVAEFYAQARLTVAPSVWFEGMPMVVAEAMLSERPVVASRIGGLMDMIEDGISGSLVAPGDPRALAGAIHDLWTDPERAKRMGRAARASILEKCDRDLYYDRTMASFDKARRLREALP